jgi:hypothetical protein
MLSIAETTNIQISIDSDIMSFVSSATRLLQKRSNNPQDKNPNMARANEEVVEAELELAKAASLADAQGDGGASAIARPTLRGPCVSTEAWPLSLSIMQDRLLDRQDLRGSRGSPAGAGSGVQGLVYMFQQNIHSERCLLGSQTVSDRSGAVEAAIQLAERRHHEVLTAMSSVGEENHRREVEELAGQAARQINEQTVEFTNAQEAYKREPLRNNVEGARYTPAHRAAYSQGAHAAHAEVQQRDCVHEGEVQRLLIALTVAEGAIAKEEAERVQQIAHA